MEFKHVPKSANDFLEKGNLRMALLRTAMFPRNIQGGRGLSAEIKQKAAVLEQDYDKAIESVKTVTKSQVLQLFIRLDNLLNEIYNS